MVKRAIEKQFADRVRTLRLEADLSQEELALRAKISRHYLSQVESGQRNPSLVMIAQLAKGLDVPLEVLMSL